MHKAVIPRIGKGRSSLWLRRAGGIFAIIAVLAAPALAGLSMAGDAGRDGVSALAAVFAPWTDGNAAFVAAASAGAPVLRIGAWPWIVVVEAGTGRSEALRAAGAVLVLGVPGAVGCDTIERN